MSSLRLYGQAHDLKRLNEEVEAVKSTGALAPAYVVHEAIDPAQSRDEKMVRLSRYGAANAALEMKGTVRGGRPPTGQSQTTVDGHTTKQNSVESRKAHQTPSAGKKVSAPPKPPKRAAPTRSEGQKDSDWAEGFKRVVDAWFD